MARQSTSGFAIEGILLDLIGGIFSLIQLVIDASLISHDWKEVTGDPGKLGLSFISIVFDLILIVQHYVLYGSVAAALPSSDTPQRSQDDAERQPLLSS